MMAPSEEASHRADADRPAIADISPSITVLTDAARAAEIAVVACDQKIIELHDRIASVTAERQILERVRDQHNESIQQLIAILKRRP